MTNEPKTINKYKHAHLTDDNDITKSECSEDNNEGCPFYSEGRDEAIKSQTNNTACKIPNCKK